MHSEFNSISEDKQKRIINSAMKEFVEKGYKNASTNNIVADAGISKGALFYYFGSKQKLVEFLFRYSTDIFMNEMMNDTDKLTDDVIERWKFITLKKIQVITQYPLIFEFSLKMINDNSAEMHDFTKNIQKNFISDFKNKIYDNIDYIKFRDDIDADKALKLIWWSLEGYAQEVQNKVKLNNDPMDDFLEKVLAEANQYLELMKKVYYK